MELIKTEKGKPCALYNGYAYRKYRENKQGVVTWCCLKEKTSKCKGRIMSQDAEVIRVVDHQCVPDEASIDVKKAIFNVKKRTREESDTQIRQIYNEEFNSLQNMGYEFVTSLPQFSNVRSSLYSIRNQAQGVQKEPKQPGEVTFDEETLKMSDGNNFLLADNGVVDRILIFAGVKQREVMREKTSFFMDGTFRSCSAQFSQLYTIHVDLGSTLEETNVVPVIFALLPNKRKETYVRMFRMILEEVPNWVPDTVHIDFEASAISALREVFPSVNINGCYFHFTKCLWRQVQDIGLTNLYKEDSDVRFHIRLCAALAFLKPEDVDEGWILIQETAPSNEKLSEFFNYFVEQWLDNPTLTKEIWSCYHRKHRTNNAVEGWNNKINSALGRPHPRVKELIKHLKSEAEQSNLKIVRLELHMEGVKRKKKYVKLDERIEKITKRYEENSEIKEFLTKIQYVLKLE